MNKDDNKFLSKVLKYFNETNNITQTARQFKISKNTLKSWCKQQETPPISERKLIWNFHFSMQALKAIVDNFPDLTLVEITQIFKPFASQIIFLPHYFLLI